MRKRKFYLSLAALFFITGTILSQIPIDGLVGFYPFNGNADDESGNGHNGWVQGAILAPDRCGYSDSAYYFPGNYEYIELPAASEFINSTYTYSLWMKVDAWPDPSIDGWMLFSPGSATSGLCQGIGIHPDGGICATSYNIGDNPRGSWAESPAIPAKQWNHVVVTRDYEKITIYINGELMPYVETDRYQPYTNNQEANYGAPDTRFIIGCRSNFMYPYTFEGYIDDLAIYNRVLTSEEIKKLYQTTCKILPDNGLISYFPFNGNANDESGNGHNANVFGPVLTVDRCGRDNSAYHFDGIDDYMDLMSTYDYPERTVNLWFCADVIDDIERHIYVSDNPNLTNGFSQIKIREIDGIKEIRSSTGVPGPVAEAHAEVKENEWHMITLVADRDTARHYLDGIFIGKFSNSNLTSVRGYESALLGTSRVFDRFYKGKIDDLRIYNRVISEEEIKQLYQIRCNGLISYYPFNGNANDETSNANNGVIHGPVLTTDRCGNPNSAYLFDGVNDYISLDPSYIAPESRGTFAAWVYFNSLNSIQYLGCLGDTESQDFYLGFVRYDPAYNSFTIYRRSLGNVDIMAGGTDIIVNQWYFVVMTTDGNDWSLYVNGVKENLSIESGTNTGDWGSDLPQADNWLLGGIQILEPHTHAYLNGKLDDIHIYDYPLTQDEILDLFNSYCPMEITGDQQFCQGEENALFSVPLIEDLVYTWNYSGTGALLSTDMNQVTIDFSDNASSGILSVSAKRGNQTINYASLEISVLELPADPGIISGPADACLNDGPYNFIIPPIQSAQDYSWNFSGQNADLIKESNTVNVYFYNNATSGSLTVTGINQCGQGKTSQPHPVIVTNCDVPSVTINIPNSISPNGDNINDYFIINGLTDGTTVRIFDSNGKLLYQSENYQNNWNGFDLDGNLLQTGTYWYVIKIPGLNNEFKSFVYIKK